MMSPMTTTSLTSFKDPTVHYNIKFGSSKTYKVVETITPYLPFSNYLTNGSLITVNVTKISKTYYDFKVAGEDCSFSANIVNPDNTTKFIPDYSSRISYVFYPEQFSGGSIYPIQFYPSSNDNIWTNSHTWTIKIVTDYKQNSIVSPIIITEKYDLNSGWLLFYNYTWLDNSNNIPYFHQLIIESPSSIHLSLFSWSLVFLTVIVGVILVVVKKWHKRYRTNLFF